MLNNVFRVVPMSFGIMFFVIYDHFKLVNISDDPELI